MEIRKGTISGTFDLKNVSTPPGGGKGGGAFPLGRTG